MALHFDHVPTSEGELREFYRSGDFPWHDRETYASDPLVREKDELLEAEIEKLRPEKLLDVGCGCGLFLERAARHAARLAVGLDVSEKGFRAAPPANARFVAAGASALPFKNESFDCVVCSEVLEHLVSPQTALLEIRRIMTPNATLVVTVPNLFCWDSIEAKTGLVGRALGIANSVRRAMKLPPLFPAGYSTHLTKKTPGGWRKTLTGSGFSVAAELPVYVFPYVPYSLKTLKKWESALWKNRAVRKIRETAQPLARRRLPFRLPGQLHLFVCKNE
ncbi:MAG: class I SAM-dependent methyltransferase [bacterium]